MFPIREEGGKELKTFDFDKPHFAFTAYTAEHAKMLWRMGALVSRGHHCFNNIIHELKPTTLGNPGSLCVTLDITQVKRTYEAKFRPENLLENGTFLS